MSEAQANVISEDPERNHLKCCRHEVLCGLGRVFVLMGALSCKVSWRGLPGTFTQDRSAQVGRGSQFSLSRVSWAGQVWGARSAAPCTRV
jgi:hypothetical protein